jgi:hypothetical protein
MADLAIVVETATAVAEKSRIATVCEKFFLLITRENFTLAQLHILLMALSLTIIRLTQLDTLLTPQ